MVADGILIAIALITMEQLQDLEVHEVLRIGVFFIAFGTAGRRLMNSVLRSPLRPDGRLAQPKEASAASPDPAAPRTPPGAPRSNAIANPAKVFVVGIDAHVTRHFEPIALDHHEIERQADRQVGLNRRVHRDQGALGRLIDDCCCASRPDR